MRVFVLAYRRCGRGGKKNVCVVNYLSICFVLYALPAIAAVLFVEMLGCMHADDIPGA
jgi:hypothetical protein